MVTLYFYKIIMHSDTPQLISWDWLIEINGVLIKYWLCIINKLWSDQCSVQEILCCPTKFNVYLLIFHLAIFGYETLSNSVFHDCDFVSVDNYRDAYPFLSFKVGLGYHQIYDHSVPKNAAVMAHHIWLDLWWTTVQCVLQYYFALCKSMFLDH